MNWAVVLPLLIFLVVIFFVGLWANRKMAEADGFLSDYF